MRVANRPSSCVVHRCLVASSLILGLWGCAHASLTRELDSARNQVRGGSSDARTLAFAAFHALLVEGATEEAARLFESASSANAHEPYALYGQWWMARRRGLPTQMLDAALILCESHPQHPLAVAAARQLLDLAGYSTVLDKRLLERIPKVLERGIQGDAAHLLRSVLAGVYTARFDTAALSQSLQDMGIPPVLHVQGPLSAFRYLDIDEVTPTERRFGFASDDKGVWGPALIRTFGTPSGRLSLVGETAAGDIYIAAIDFEASEDAVHLVRTLHSSTHKIYLDGQLLFTRPHYQRVLGTVAVAPVSLRKGKHRLLFKWIKDSTGEPLTISLARADGKPARLHFSKEVPLSAPPPLGRPALVHDKPLPQVMPDAADLHRALLPEAGDALARFIAIEDALGRDRDGAKRLLAESKASFPNVSAWRWLQTQMAQEDDTVPPKVARGRMTRDLEATLEGDPKNVQALLLSAQVALEDGRLVDASEQVKRAKTAAGTLKAGPPLSVMDGRVALALGVEAQAEQSALEALKADSGACDALGLRYELAQRRDQVVLMDELVTQSQYCQGATVRLADHLKARGKPADAVPLYERALRLEPSSIGSSLALVDVYISLRRYDAGLALLEKMTSLWPRAAVLWKKRADVLELAGKRTEAVAEREKALLLDGSDLSLRRSVERAKTGKEPLAEFAIEGKRALSAYSQRNETEEATSALVLDAAAVRVYPDGSMVDRVHIIQKALDQTGVSDIAEVSIPPGAQLLSLRTLKADGTVLEPEVIEGKDAVSLPGVQVGDFVEYEYLLAHPSRGPAIPGFTASPFYFRVAREPNSWSTYAVVAPHSMGMGVDAHNTKAVAPERRGDEDVFFHEQRQVPPYFPEPNAAPSMNEYLPFVSVGAGATGNAPLIAALSDGLLEGAQITQEVEAFAKEAAQEKKGLEAVRAVYAAVMERVAGPDAGLASNAAASLAEGRGSRLWALKATLESLGFETRIVSIRTFGVDPAPYRYPQESLVPYLGLRVSVPGVTEPVWLDPVIRFAPFGELPEAATGKREGLLFPEPGRPGGLVQSPAKANREGKQVRLRMKLNEQGELSGTGEELYTGVEAAVLAEALEAIPPDQRNQSLQGALSRYFGGADLSKLTVTSDRKVGAPLGIQYEFTAARFAREEGPDRRVLSALTFPANFGRRYITQGSRTTPLYIDQTEHTKSHVELEIPPGFQLIRPLSHIEAKSPFGNYVRTEVQKGNRITIEESYTLFANRIPPQQYGDLIQFAGEVDLLQGRDLLLEKK